MMALPIIHKAHVSDFLNRIGNLASGSTKVNTDANHEKITAYSASEPLEPGRNPFPNCDTVSLWEGDFTKAVSLRKPILTQSRGQSFPS